MSSQNDCHNGLPESNSRNWWQANDIDIGECPITLESLSSLPYPPFALSTGATADGTAHQETRPSFSLGTNHDKTNSCRSGQLSYFDGLALATYIVSRGIFQNPLTRQELTMQDCRRLDEYLAEYCFKNNNNDQGRTQYRSVSNSQRNICVAEAYALRNSVRVDVGISNGNSNNGGSVQRMQALRNAATAALTGLFVYGNQGRSHYTMGENPIRDNGTDPPILDWGFDLSRTVDNTAEFSGGEEGYGWTVIDDDEAAVVASRRHAYETVQGAFPPLQSSAVVHDSTSIHQPTHSSAAITTLDEQLLERVRAVAIQDREAQAQRARQIELTRQRLLQDALAKREERRQLRAAKLARGAEVYQNQKIEEEETRQARAEIEAWRDDQWEKLRLLSERQTRAEWKQEDTTNAYTTADEGEKNGVGSPSGGINESDLDSCQEGYGPNSEEVQVAKRKAKAAAKRRRLKERKKLQNSEERESIRRLMMKEAEEAKKSASILKCAACGQGVIDCGFEKFGETFCSTKCARTAKPKNPS